MKMKGLFGCRFKNCEILDILNYCETTIEVMVKWVLPLDSAHQIGPETIFS
jgi:hypothetical protein